jgi:thiamine pyrophosphate-dependent acetolactate synthase large subunit-like protein
VKHSDCVRQLAEWVPESALTATSLSGNARMWCALGGDRPSFYGLQMGLCLGFAVGLSLAFPQRRVLALEGDGSLMIDTSALITAAEVSPPNLLAIVFDNGSYARMGPTATSHGTDLELMARGAGIRRTATLRTPEEFEQAVQEGLNASAFTFLVAKVEIEPQRFASTYDQRSERAMKEFFLDDIRRLPDYRGG